MLAVIAVVDGSFHREVRDLTMFDDALDPLLLVLYASHGSAFSARSWRYGSPQGSGAMAPAAGGRASIIP